MKPTMHKPAGAGTAFPYTVSFEYKGGGTWGPQSPPCLQPASRSSGAPLCGGCNGREAAYGAPATPPKRDPKGSLAPDAPQRPRPAARTGRRYPAGLPLYTLVILAALFFSGCGQINALRERITGRKDPAAPGGAPMAQERPVFAVNTTTASQGQIRDYLALSGDIIAGSTVDAYSDVAGKITRVFVAIGSRVRQGDPIAEVDPSRPGMNYVPGIAAAPVSGTVVALPAQMGMTVAQTVPLARIAAGNVLEIRLYVAERFISKMTLRLPCEITLDAYPGEIFQGRIIELSPVVDPASRTMEVRVGVTNTGNKLKAGMFAKVRIITETKNNIVKIPSAALLQRFGESYVFTVETDPTDPAFRVARKQAVVPGISIDGALEIQQGLKPDDEVIIRGQTLLEDGARINVVDRVAPLSAGN